MTSINLDVTIYVRMLTANLFNWKMKNSILLNTHGENMNSFVEAVKEVQEETYTENGMVTYTSSKDHLVDLFFTIGASRGKNLSVEFVRAYKQDETLALRLLLWARDIRGGAGEREVVRNILRSMERSYPDIVLRIMPHLAEFGRWDDLLIFSHPAIKLQAYKYIQLSLESGNGLCAKWMPRKGMIANELRNFLKLSPKGYRKLLVNLTEVVETKMCANQWTDINYSHVPSVAASRYQRAFARHDSEGYEAYKKALTTGEAKVNAGAVYPYDIVKSFRNGGDREVTLAQWQALPNYIGDELVLPMVDVSGSMCMRIAGNDNLECIDVAVSLGLYLADKNTGPFKDMFLTFTNEANLEILKGNLIDKLNQMKSSEWGMNTNLEAAFDSVLNYAVKGKVAAEDMPKFMLILSDMEFDEAISTSLEEARDLSAMEMIKEKYAAAGYTVPNIIFWNLNSRNKNSPVKFDADGTALISGFSPSIMKSVLNCKDINPRAIMLRTLNDPRYASVIA